MPGRMVLAFALAFAAAAPLSAIAASVADAGSRAKPALEVIMYSTATCGYCAKARQWFTGHKVAWDERDVETSTAAQKEWKALGGVGTPLIVVNGKPFHGFMEGAIEAEIAKYR
ncbi:MAG: glutaredoxin domain-containing protein [Dokdonella sp.]|uniref:glutaredoxin family protein n=1 Tax=Dokdonella sp. TaxID=2291710 RepID=UPI002BD9DE3A|nr:glutaredoxin family protein [Xanthomonadales bacterium]HQV73170.1 glutaredoxin domain-containing protein [Dokdonella sp.]HQX64704.1 glutaredoxin domain-containing protein [Dokdonella sp.]HQY54884.1 glutaredoxin domain-containing protein [Dokdonella sp.]